jgi:hypothetical protein
MLQNFLIGTAPGIDIRHSGNWNNDKQIMARCDVEVMKLRYDMTIALYEINEAL